MSNVTRFTEPPNSQTAILELLNRIIRMLERHERQTDEYRGAYLNAKFPYGKPTDRWSRRS